MNNARVRWLFGAVGAAAILGTVVVWPWWADTQAAERKGKSYAFLVACKEYDKKELRPLKYTQDDVTAFSKALLAAGYDKENIVLMHDGQKRRYQPEAAKIKEELTLLLGELGKDDSLIIALSGHGVQYKGDAHAYFCPLDARLKDKTNLIALDWLYGQMKKCKARLKLLLVDACRNDPRSTLGKGRAEVDLEKLTGLSEEPPKGIVALFSCSEGQESFEDPELKHGIFFHHVLKGLKGEAANKQGKVTLANLIDYVEEKTPKYARLNLKARQTPEHQGQGSGVWVLRQELDEPKEITNLIGMKLVRIPAGKFTMGSPNTEKEREPFNKGSEKEHPVEITRPFYMGIHEVTQKQYRDVMEKDPSYFSSTGKGKDKVKGLDTDDFPVEQVSWEDADKFCKALTTLEKKKGIERVYRLPTEAEWEYACRGGASSIPFHFGDTLSSTQANFDGRSPYGDAAKGDYLERTTTVGSYKANKFGLYDMHGNVWEWCNDWYDKDYYTNSPIKDPQGQENGTARVLRGGSWLYLGRNCRAALRNGSEPGFRFNDVGFRVVFSAGVRTE